MNKTKIEWCDSTWNPVTGCYNGCGYCFMKDSLIPIVGEENMRREFPWKTEREAERK